MEVLGVNEEFLNLKQVSPVSELESTGPLSAVQTQVKILQSDSLLERTLTQVGAVTPTALRPQSNRQGLIARLLKREKPPESLPDALDLARESLHVRGDNQTRIVEVFFDSTDPRLAAKLANTLVYEYIQQGVEGRWRQATRTSQWLQRQLEELRLKLRTSEDALQAYARSADLTVISEKAPISEDRLRQIQDNLTKAHAERVATYSRWQVAERSNPVALSDAVNDSTLRDYEAKITDLRRQRAEMATIYTSDFERVKRIDAQIATLENALAASRKVILQRIRNEYEEAAGREMVLAEDFRNQTRLVARDAGKSIQYNMLKRELDSDRQLYEAMLQKTKEVQAAAAMSAGRARIIDHAQPPRRHYSPRTTFNSVVSLFAGILLACAFVLFRDRADETIRIPSELEDAVPLPSLGIIPSARPVTGPRRFLPGASAVPSLALVPRKPSLFADASGPLAGTFVTALKGGALDEAIRAVMTSILFSSSEGKVPKVIVVTSSNEKEGKSTLVSNLAVALGEIGSRVLLIDGDIYRPHLHRIFGLSSELGLVDYLRSRTSPLTSSIARLARPTQIKNVSLLTSGCDSHTGALFLYGPTLPELVEEARRDFDSVLIDTPPLLSTPDARMFGKLSDGVILVVRAGRTNAGEALAVRNRLVEDGIPILGSVLNDWNPAHHYGGGYGARYSDYSPANRTYRPIGA
jgi:capsular exopolysaccharide synthesis family protein